MRSEIAVLGDNGTPRAPSVTAIRRWTVEQFAHAAADWSRLLPRTAANPLFMSWEWQWNWWKHHADVLKAELVMLAGYEEGGRLVGLAPLYLHRGTHRGFIAPRIESLGSSWRNGGHTVFSEYLDFIVEPEYAASFSASVAGELLTDDRWSDLVLCNTIVDGVAAGTVREHLVPRHHYVRSVDPLVSHTAKLPRCFDDYVQTLNRTTRRRVWNHRKKLQEPELHGISGEHVAEALDQLNTFHRLRWGTEHYVGVRRAFHQQFAAAMSERHALRMSELRSAGRTLSVMYNVRVAGVEYNVQSGFDGEQGRGISPGYLHFGYCIERACAEGVTTFDFLGGPGLHREYKRDFRTTQSQMITLQSIRSRSLAWLYREYDRVFASADAPSQRTTAPLLSFA